MAVAQNSKVRFAIGLFQSPEALSMAIEALSCRGVGSEKLNILPGAGGAAGQGADERMRPGQTLVIDDETMPERLVFDLLVGSLSGQNGEQVAQCVGFDEWTMERQSRRLHRHVADGGQTLVVRLQDDSQRQDVCALLLKFADRGLQTHELRVVS